jgi:hypothetical protein
MDLHPTLADKELGRDLTEEMVAHLLERCRPDFIQYDSKGHPGYLGFPSETGMSATGIVKDSLAIWRRVTAAHGVGLYNHFSGVLDGAAVAKHPAWARIGPDGHRHDQATSLFSAYEHDLEIPELLEAAQKYDLDGSWVDGDCWAVQPDYCEASKREFASKSGLTVLPKGPADPGWNEFLELQRERFRRYVTTYVEALHAARPGYAITSNWLYSTFVPEKPEVPVDFLSGDLADHAAVRQARLEARYLQCTSKPWDLMSWGFEFGDEFKATSTKPVVELQQEAAVVMAQGGAYQIYFVPTRAGWIDERIIDTCADVSSFCRKRQEWSHKTETVPEVGILFSGRTLYRTADHAFGGWGKAANPAMGAIEMLLGCGYSVDVIPDWQVSETADKYPSIVLPDWKDIGDKVSSALLSYVARGGKLLICGAENTRLFATPLGLQTVGEPVYRDYLIANANGFAEVGGNWLELSGEHEIVTQAYRNADTRKGSIPLAIRLKHGSGGIILCPSPLCSAYAGESSPILKETMRQLMGTFEEPRVRLDRALPQIEVVLRKKSSQLLVHLVNTLGAPISSDFRHSGVVPPTGPVNITIRLSARPSKVVLEPAGVALQGRYEAGAWSGTVQEIGVHSILRIAGAM